VCNSSAVLQPYYFIRGERRTGGWVLPGRLSGHRGDENKFSAPGWNGTLIQGRIYMGGGGGSGAASPVRYSPRRQQNEYLK
jgi:hypothetical protein